MSDFRRKNGERLLLITQVKLASSDGKTTMVGKTSNMSKGGSLLLVDPEQGEQLVLLDTVVVEFVELAKKYALEKRFVEYQIVDIKPSIDAYRIALRRTNSGDSTEFEQLIQHLMNEHKRRNRLDVDNTIHALSARSHNMASIAQLNALVVMSNRKNRYHLLVSQGHTLSLQGELLLSEHLIPQMVEQTDAGECKQFFVWAYGQNEVFLADLESMAQKGAFESNLRVWGNAPWHKTFMVKAASMDAKLANLGTSIPASVSPVADKLNAPLPAKVAQFVQELSKILVIEDVSYVMDGITPPPAKGIEGRRRLSQFSITKSIGPLRQIPFNIKELPDFKGTYRFSHDCELSHQKKSFKIVNGHADCRDAVVSLPLKNHQLPKGSKVAITWNIGEIRISIDATVTGYDQLHKRVALKFDDNPQMVKQLFKELENLKAFNPAFIEDVQANKLDVAVRNLILSNLPMVSIFTQAKRQAMALTALTGHQHLPKHFIDASTEVKLDELFSQQILLKLASSKKHHKEIL
ncbi:MAG: PilZ domain-containing protein, partial [Psychrosphaera sp.]|nr:PilZ domain-containing protein [Psychrosphaera sp.]